MDDEQVGPRAENEIFDDIRQLCLLPGFVHALSFLAFRDCPAFSEGEEFRIEDLLPLTSKERLVRTELSTLVGLLVQAPISFEHPGPEIILQMIESADRLLQEMHRVLVPSLESLLAVKGKEEEPTHPLFSGKFFREQIFYGGESAYIFQYRDFAAEKYRKDAQWFLDNKGFHPQDLVTIQRALGSLCLENLEKMSGRHPDQWTTLAAHEFTISELASESGLIESRVRAFVNSFSCPIGENEGFESISDFNVANAYPFISKGEERYILFQSYSLAEAGYETPFFWMHDDKAYRPEAMDHRGDFTEEVCLEFMSRVFPAKSLFPNVNIVDGRGTILGEIDLLVVYANRAIVLQAKSKKLTIASRKGNDLVIRDDFEKGVQAAYEQGVFCSKMLLEQDNKLVDCEGREIDIHRNYDEIFILCVLSEHYPALSFQARQFLAIEEIEQVRPPFVSDVFFLDAATEMLRSPVRFLSYLNRRGVYYEKILATHELTILSYHLKMNLWVESKYNMMSLDDGISADLDLAMEVRREGIPGSDTPDGVLTRFTDTAAGDILEQIERLEEPSSIDLGYLLLEMSEEALNDLSGYIETICTATLADRQLHDATMGVGIGRTGITVHSSYETDNVALRALESHMELRKYSRRANSWYGLSVHPETRKVRLGVKIDKAWEFLSEMEDVVREWRQAKDGPTYREVRTPYKIGRNEKCPCGSGKKYKKCCLI